MGVSGSRDGVLEGEAKEPYHQRREPRNRAQRKTSVLPIPRTKMDWSQGRGGEREET